MLPLQLLKIWLTVQMQFKVVTALLTFYKTINKKDAISNCLL